MSVNRYNIPVPTGHEVHVEMEDGLGCRLSVGLDDVQPLGVNRLSDRPREADRRACQALCGHFIQFPDVGYVLAGNHHRVTEDGGLGREEGDDVLVPVDLAGVRVIPLDDLAEGAALSPTHDLTFP